jgi:CRP/FNR family transcriptional activator FtrB
MKAGEIDEIRNLPLFAAMSAESFEALFRGAYVQNFPPQIELIREGDPADFLHVVLEGSVELFATWNNRETTMATVAPISTFILAATIKNGPYLMSARTLEKTRVILLPSGDVRKIFSTDVDFAQAIILDLAQCYRSVVKSHKDLKLRTSVERLANYLLRKDQQSGERGHFDLKIEKRRLASYLGMTAENLSRAIRTLNGYGVEIDGSQVRITDRQHLKNFAKPTPLIDDPMC